MRHIRLLMEYDGTAYAGFQIQPSVPTIQGTLQGALSALLGEPTGIRGASRTDAGVHASGQVVTFTTEHGIPLDRLPQALNALLPADIVCREAAAVAAEFHPQYSARRKRYLYQVLNRPLPCAFRARYAWHVPQPLDVAAMFEAGQSLVGEHDFSAFCAAGGSAQTMTRTVEQLACCGEGEVVTFEVVGNGFLYMMVRIIVGTLVEVGLGRMPGEQVAMILDSKDRGQAGPTAPPQGLSLMQVEY
jgi:tRNA pseudouridine38-40 synthase